jgi:hypothetical protein
MIPVLHAIMAVAETEADLTLHVILLPLVVEVATAVAVAAAEVPVLRVTEAEDLKTKHHEKSFHHIGNLRWNCPDGHSPK